MPSPATACPPRVPRYRLRRQRPPLGAGALPPQARPVLCFLPTPSPLPVSAPRGRGGGRGAAGPSREPRSRRRSPSAGCRRPSLGPGRGSARAGPLRGERCSGVRGGDAGSLRNAAGAGEGGGGVQRVPSLPGRCQPGRRERRGEQEGRGGGRHTHRGSPIPASGIWQLRDRGSEHRMLTQPGWDGGKRAPG